MCGPQGPQGFQGPTGADDDLDRSYFVQNTDAVTAGVYDSWYPFPIGLVQNTGAGNYFIPAVVNVSNISYLEGDDGDQWVANVTLSVTGPETFVSGFAVTVLLPAVLVENGTAGSNLSQVGAGNILSTIGEATRLNQVDVLQSSVARTEDNCAYAQLWVHGRSTLYQFGQDAGDSLLPGDQLFFNLTYTVLPPAETPVVVVRSRSTRRR